MEQSGNRVSKLDEWQDTLRNQVLGRTRFSLAAHSFVSLAFSGGYLTAFLWGSVSLSKGAITFGTMAAFLQLVGKVQRPVLDLSRLIPSFAQVFTAIDRLEELERLPEESGEESIRFAETPDVEIDNITFRYVEGEAPVFSHFSCKFPAGSCTAVMGETGRGKTTLVRMLLALALPEGGEHCASHAFTVAIVFVCAGRSRCRKRLALFLRPRAVILLMYPKGILCLAVLSVRTS